MNTAKNILNEKRVIYALHDEIRSSSKSWNWSMSKQQVLQSGRRIWAKIEFVVEVEVDWFFKTKRSKVFNTQISIAPIRIFLH